MKIKEILNFINYCKSNHLKIKENKRKIFLADC